jgi:hypothetical protein
MDKDEEYEACDRVMHLDNLDKYILRCEQSCDLLREILEDQDEVLQGLYADRAHWEQHH